MTSRKSKADDFGYRKGALGRFDPGAKLDRNYDPWNPRVLTDDLNPAADAAAKYSSNDDAGLREGKTDAENYPKVDIWDLAESQSDRTGPVRLRKRDQE